jgi:50S ribosomal subunit-associated GTPase HflX
VRHLATSSSLFSNDQIMEAEAVQHDLLMQQYRLKVMDTQQVLVVQPWYPPNHHWARPDTNDELMMAETLGLVFTLGWNVIDGLSIVIRENSDRYFLGTGQLEQLKAMISDLEGNQGKYVSCVFLSTYRLSSKQRITMETILERPVMDRYNVILQIFHKHAQTKEAKLQVQ